jgi:hypothetical protein
MGDKSGLDEVLEQLNLLYDDTNKGIVEHR